MQNKFSVDFWLKIHFQSFDTFKNKSPSIIYLERHTRIVTENFLTGNEKIRNEFLIILY